MWADVLSTAPPGAAYGFANPSIYAIAKDPARYAAAFTDITAGTNGLNPALGGYDYVTGFGAPRLAGLISQVQAVTGIAGRPGAAASACTDRTAPVSKFARRRAVQASRKRLSLTGTAGDRGCRAHGAGRVKRVRVAVARRAGKRCRFLQGKKGFTKPRTCSKRVFMAAKGTTHWRFAFRGRLAKGRYSAYVRATDVAGNVPRKLPSTAIRAFRVR
jgi:hypothetical protein